jgi:hypothetical protein
MSAGDFFLIDGRAGGRIAVESFLECADAVERGTVCVGGVFGNVAGIA